jgi:hypothetical protein
MGCVFALLNEENRQEATSADGASALHLAAQSGNVEVAKILLQVIFFFFFVCFFFIIISRRLMLQRDQACVLLATSRG